MIDDRIESESARERQRAWLVNTVLLAQALITLMVAPGYLIPSANVPMLAALGAALLCYLAAFIIARVQRQLRAAVFTFIVGGALTTAAQAFLLAALQHDAAHTAQVSLLFLPIILEAGLFLTPELTLLVASASAILTASAILLALALSSAASGQLSQAYLVMVYALGLEVFIGYLAWRLAQFIYDTLKSAQAEENLRFSQALLTATQQQMEEQRLQTIRTIGGFQMAISGALAHEYDVRVEEPEGDLAPLAASLNLLIQQLRSTNELERRVQRMEAQAAPLVDMAGRLVSGAPPAQGAAAPSDSALYSLQVALNQAQAVNARRQTRLQELTAEIANTLRHSREGFANTGNEAARARQIAGQLVALAETLQQTAQRQAELLAQARRALALTLPPAVTQSSADDATPYEANTLEAGGASGLLGLGAHIGIVNPGLTGEFTVLEPLEGDATGIAPMTAPLPTPPTLSALDPVTATGPARAAGDAEEAGAVLAVSPDALPAGLADAWLLLTQLQAQTINESHAVASFVHDIGVLGRHVRHTSAGIDWAHQAIEATERDIERMQQLVNSVGAAEAGDESGSGLAPRPAPPSMPRRPPMVTRPLEDDRWRGVDPNGSFANQPPAGASSGVNPAPGQAPTQAQNQAPAQAPGSLRVSDLLNFDAAPPSSSDALLPSDALPPLEPPEQQG